MGTPEEKKITVLLCIWQHFVAYQLSWHLQVHNGRNILLEEAWLIIKSSPIIGGHTSNCFFNKETQMDHPD